MYIYGYGKLENVQINNLTDFQVFFGENEAGKSTIMAFIHGVLFGFPTKQSSELRYEPKQNTKYGGKIRIYHEKQGFAVIERVKGKAAGDVVVSLENGTLGGEELLKELLANFDKSLFQSIFSFNLHGLQNIHQMKGDEIGKFLFSAGTLGTERLTQTEAVIQKELDARFKPGGKKPLLNEKLQALHEINGELKKASAKNQEYEVLIEKKEGLQQEMEGISGKLQMLQEKLEKLNEWKKIQTFVEEEKWTKNEITELGDIQFPARGIERVEKLNQLLRPYNAQIASMAERIENLRKELDSVQPNLSLLGNESTLLTLLDQIPLYEQLKLEKQKCDVLLKECDEKLSMVKERLHLPLQEEEIAKINTNIYIKDQVEVVSRKGQKLLEVKQDLEDRFREEKNTLEEMEKEVQVVESQVIPNLERDRIEEQINAGDKKTIEMELKEVKDKIEFYHHAFVRNQNTNEKLQRQRRNQFFTFELMLIGLTLYGLLTRQWVVLFIGLACCVLIGVFMGKSLRQHQEDGTNQPVEGLREREKQLNLQLQSTDYLNVSALEDQLNRDNQRREQLQMVKVKLEQQNTQYEKVISKFEEWELESAQYKKELTAISKELNIPEYMATAHLREAFQLIEQFKIVGREKRQCLERIEPIALKQSKIVEGLEFYANRYLPDGHMDLHKSGYLLRTKLKEENERKIMSQEKRGKLMDLEADMQQKKREQQHVQSDLNKLLEEADVENEQQFYELGNNADQQTRLNERLEDLQRQLQYSLLTESERSTFLQIHNGAELIDEYNHESLGLHAQLKSLQEEQASIKYEIQVLEEGGVYSDLLHRYKQEKSEFEEAAKEWSVYCLAKDILSKTIEKYKNVHLPRMLSKAEEYLSFLTEGSYYKIHLQSAVSGFLIERNDHTLFEANELSQATTEQVYVSIRLALATTIYEKYHLPIMIDDSFVNFDAKRTEKMIELLNRFDRNQILFFTCHTHLLKLFQKGNVLRLEKGAVLDSIIE